MGSKPSGNVLFSYLEEVLPDYSKESVYASDVKKLITWYNTLMKYNVDLEEEEGQDEEPGEEEIKDAEETKTEAATETGAEEREEK